MAEFTTLSLEGIANVPKASPNVAGKVLWAESFEDIPLGRSVNGWGIPIRIGSGKSARSKAVIALTGGAHKKLPREVSLAVNRTAHHIVFQHFCVPPVLKDWYVVSPEPGVKLADYEIAYGDGEVVAQPIRRRFEIGDRLPSFRHPSFLCRPHAPPVIFDESTPWGKRQCAVNAADSMGRPVMWLYTWRNPHPSKTIKTITFRSTGESIVAIAAVTLCHTKEYPFPREANRDVKVTFLKKKDADKPYDVECGLDRGQVSAQRPLPPPPDETPVKGWGKKKTPAKRSPVMVTGYGTRSATLTVKTPDSKHAVGWGDVIEKGATTTKDKRVRVELMDPGKVWVRVKVTDPDTGKPTPCRIHFHGEHGQYLAPHGHQTDINQMWFEDIGGDLQLGQTSYAYIDGQCQMWLPVGKVTVEIAKGFEYAPVQKVVQVRKSTKDIELRIARWIDLEREGYYTGDTHVHFISPSTAHLEAQAEGVRIVNVLQTQLGRLFTNRADFTGKPFVSDDGESIVYVSQENRQHIMGHISLLGLKEPVMPWCSGGPGEAELGGGMETCLSEWADECKKQNGLVVYPHFPAPTAEIAALVPTGRVDAAEVRGFSQVKDQDGSDKVFDYAFTEWYRFLNLGYRLPAVGGTDKMANGMPVGGVRTYVYVGRDRQLNYADWCDGIRKGRTFTSSGPVISLEVDGRQVGDTIKMTRSGGTVEFKASAQCANPFDAIELVQNGRVVASAKTGRNGKKAELSGTLVIDKSCWLAARCWGREAVYHEWPVSLGAHTSPVYVYLGRNDIFNMADATYMLTLIQGSVDYVDHVALHREGSDGKDTVKGYLLDGAQALHRRMHQLGLPH